MAIYEYACLNQNCQHQWEEMQSIKDPKITICPKCQQETAKRLISVSSFVLSGGGWAREGYSNK